MKNTLTVLFMLLSLIPCKAEEFWTRSKGLNGKESAKFMCVGKDNSLYAATNTMLFKSTNSGKNWTRILKEIPEFGYFRIYDMCVDSSGNVCLLDDRSIHCLKPNDKEFKLSPPFFRNYVEKTPYYWYLTNIFGKASAFGYQSIDVYGDTYLDYYDIDLSYEKFYDNQLACVGYSKRFGILKSYKSNQIFNYYFDNPGLIYSSLDTGRTWIRHDKIPGTDIHISKMLPIDEDRYLVDFDVQNNYSDWRIYNYKTNKLTTTNLGGDLPKFNVFKNEMYIHNAYYIYYSNDFGDSFIDLSEKFIKKNGIDTISCFAIDSSGYIYINSANNGIAKSTDKGETWSDASINSEDCRAIANIKMYQGVLYACNAEDKIYKSLDSGFNWQTIQLAKPYHKASAYDINNKGEMVYGVFDTLFYSSDAGKNWNVMESNWYSGSKMTYAKMFDDGRIYCVAGNAMFAKNHNSALSICSVIFSDVVDVPDSMLLGVSNNLLFYADANFENSIELNYAFGIRSTFNPYSCVLVSKKGDIYAGTESGLFKRDKDKIGWTKFTDLGIKKLTEDANGNLYGINYLDFTQIKPDYSTIELNAGLPAGVRKNIFAFGDNQIIAHSEYCYKADMRNFKFLKLIDIDGLTNANPHHFTAISNLGDTVRNATFVAYNRYSGQLDSAKFDSNGICSYRFKKPKDYDSDFYVLEAKAYKEGYATGASVLVIMQDNTDTPAEEKAFVMKKDQEYYSQFRPKQKYSVEFRILKAFYVTTPGNLYINNIITGNSDTLRFDSNFVNYSFKIPAGTKPGLYKLTITGDADTLGPIYKYWTYVVVDDFNEIIVSVAGRDNKPTDLNIFPNPVENILNVNANENLEGDQCTIISSIGKLMYEGIYLNNIDISAYSPGAYFIQIGKYFGKFIKK